jgi:hypothetical protein
MGKRTSDLVALATILGGVGVGYGVTSLFAGSAPVPVDRVSVDVRIVPGRVLVRDGSATSTIYFRSRAEANRVDVEEIRRREVREMELAKRVELEKLVVELEEARVELTLEAKELYEEALEELDCLQAAAQGDEDEDQRRRRRRRPCR